MPFVTIDLPPYETPRNAWRKRIHHAAVISLSTAGVSYSATDRLAVHVDLYMNPDMLRFHDVDNRLKDVLDALQGRVGGTKSSGSKKGKLQALIPNDWQVFEATVRKSVGSGEPDCGGRIAIRRLDDPGAA